MLILSLLFDGVQIDLVSYALRCLAGYICKFLYPLIASLFELFMNISRVEILGSGEILGVYKRVTIILTIIMIFYVTFETVKYVINPEKISDKETGAGKIAVKMIIVVVLLAMVPQIFRYAFRLQNIVIENGIIGKVIVGPTASGGDPRTAGRELSTTLFSLFFSYQDYGQETWGTNEHFLSSCYLAQRDIQIPEAFESYFNRGQLSIITAPYWTSNKINDGKESKTIGRILCTFKNTGKFPDAFIGDLGLSMDEDADDPIPLIKFDGLLAIIVGAFMCYILALYCIDLGTRVAQLAFLQIIAPIPIIGYLSPKKDNMFSKWVKQCTTTYLDLFLRTAIIYFILLICGRITTAMSNGTLFRNMPVGSNNTLIYIAIILGLLLFAQKAPKLLEELFPKMGAASGNFGLKQKDRLSAISRGAGVALGATRLFGGAVSRGVNAYKRNKRIEAETGKTKKERKQDAKEAKRERARARAAYKQAKRGGARGENLKKQRDEMIEAESKYADARNKKNRSVFSNAATGALSGAWTGARIGFGSKEMKDVMKKRREAVEKDKQNIANVEQWLNSGGYSQVERFKSRIEQKVGITTDAGRTENTIKYYDNKVKMHETLSKLESDTKTKRDAVETRLDSKIEKGELNKVALQQRKIKDASGNVIGYTIDGIKEALDLHAGDTASSLYARYRAKTETAKLALDAATKTGDEAEIAKAEAEYGKAQDLEKTVRKYAMRDTFTQALHSPNQTGTDPVAVEAITTMKTSISIAKSNFPVMKDYASKLIDDDTSLTSDQKTELKMQITEQCPNMEALQALINGTSLTEKTDWDHLINEDYENMSYDDLDRIVVRFQNNSNENQRRVSEYAETKRKYESSDEYASQKADDTASKPSGK